MNGVSMFKNYIDISIFNIDVYTDSELLRNAPHYPYCHTTVLNNSVHVIDVHLFG